MFIGHFAIALGARSKTNSLSLGTLFLAAQLLDLIWPALVLLGVESVRVVPGATAVTPLDFAHYPWSHSLATTLLWSLMLGVGLLALGSRGWEAVVAAGVVSSHWLLDFVTHRPDLPLAPGSDTRLGLALWNSLGATLLIEGGLFALGVWLYSRATVALDRRGSWGFWALVVFLISVYALNVLGPPPPAETSGKALAAPALAMWLIVLWGYWIDRHRSSVKLSRPAATVDGSVPFTRGSTRGRRAPLTL